LDTVLRKFYGENETRIAAVISLLMDSFEKSDYWLVMQHMEASRAGEVSEMANAFSEFGMLDIALMGQQSGYRLAMIDDLEKIIFNPETTPQLLHKTLANNLWILGNSYSLVSTRSDLHEVTQMYIGRKFTNGHAAHAPNLLLLQDFQKRFILIDLKKPDHTLEIPDRRLAKEYQADLKVFLPDRDIEVLVIGGALSQGMVPQKASADIRFLSYKGMLSDARVQLNWMLGELQKR
jgi:hypothetical protein